MRKPMAMKPGRETRGARLALTLRPAPASEIVVGIDSQGNEHASRMTMNQNMRPYASLARSSDAEFDQRGVFAELGHDLGDRSRIVGGARIDWWQATDQRQRKALNMMVSLANPTAGETRQDTLHSGFLRYERLLRDFGSFGGAGATTFFVGLGHSERFPDYWEMIAKESADSLSAFHIDAEKTTQLDLGLMFRNGGWDGSASFFVSEIKDFLMIESGYQKPAADAMGMGGMNMSGMNMGMGGMAMAATRSASIVRNIDARTWGLELDGQYRFSDSWRAELTLASVRGANDSDGRTLPQLPPLEGRAGVYFDNSTWSAGLFWRAIASQDRFDLGRGNIVGQDFGPTDSASIVSINGGWRIAESVTLTGGIDNLFDKTYAEHVSRAGALIPGFDQVARVNEPGRTLWLRAQLSL